MMAVTDGWKRRFTWVRFKISELICRECNLFWYTYWWFVKIALSFVVNGVNGALLSSWIAKVVGALVLATPHPPSRTPLDSDQERRLQFLLRTLENLFSNSGFHRSLRFKYCTRSEVGSVTRRWYCCG